MRFLFGIITLFVLQSASASDSLRTETVNGKYVMVYRVEQGQTLYSIARKFGISVNDIKALNPNMTQLKSGSEIYLPTKFKSQTEEVKEGRSEKQGTDAPDLQTHIVKQGETVYKIARMYNVSPSEISKANNLSNGLKIGQELIIPQKNDLTETQTTTTKPSTQPATPIIKTEKKTSATGYPAISESGLAKLDESIGNEPTYSVFHKTAAIGTLLLIKNKENSKTAHVKVIGNTKSTETCLLLMNKKVLEQLESSSNSFVVEIFYTPEQ